MVVGKTFICNVLIILWESSSGNRIIIRVWSEYNQNVAKKKKIANYREVSKEEYSVLLELGMGFCT